MSVVQIAERAGVSIATVSRVLNNSRRVQPQIIEQVRKAMEELNLPARHSRRRGRTGRRRTGAIAILSLGQSYRGWFEMPVIGAVVAEITRVAEEHELGVRMTEMIDPTQLSAVVQQQQVDGAIVFVPSGLDARATSMLQQHIPIVRAMGAQVASLNIDHIGPDNLAIGHLAAEYLLERGCRELAFLSTQPTWSISKLRSVGFAIAGRQAGITPTAYLVTEDADEAAAFCTSTSTRATLAELVDELVARRPAGVFVSRDEEVVQVYRLLAERGVTPGTDMTVVSCDNENVRLSMLHPRPASIEIGTAEIARFAVRRLVQRIKHPEDPPVRILVNPKLVLPVNGVGHSAPRIGVDGEGMA